MVLQVNPGRASVGRSGTVGGFVLRRGKGRGKRKAGEKKQGKKDLYQQGRGSIAVVKHLTEAQWTKQECMR